MRERVGDGVEQRPCLYRFINFEDQVLSGLAPAAHVKKGLSGSQARNGAFRSEGLERLVTGQHVPDRLGQLAGELDLRDLGAALAAEAALGALVALLVERVREAWIAASMSPQRRYLGPCLEIGPRRSTSPDWFTRGHRPVYPVSLTGEAKRAMSPISAAIVKPVTHPIPGALINSGM